MRDTGAVQQQQQQQRQQKSHRRGLTEDDMDQPSRPTIRPPTQTNKKKSKKNRKNVKKDSSLPLKKKEDNLKRSADLVLAPATQPGAVHMNQDYPTTKSELRRQQQQQQQDQQHRPPRRQGSDKSSLSSSSKALSSRLSMAQEPVTDDSVTTNTVTVSTRPSLGQQQRSTGRSTRSTLSGSSRSMRSNPTGSHQGGSTRSGFTVNTMGTASNASKPGAHAVFNSNAIPEDASVTHSLSTHNNAPPNHDLESSSDPVASVIDPNDLEAEIEERINREAANRVQSMMIQTAQVTLVQPMEHPSTPHPAVGFGVPEEEQEEKEGRSFMERMLLPLICCVMIVLGASVGTVLAVILTRNSGGGGDSTNSNNTGGGVVNNTNTPGPQAPPPVGAPSVVIVAGEDMIPTFSPTTSAWSDVESVVVNVTSVARLRDPASPQHAAVQWILQEDTLFPTLPLAEQQERFILVTLFFATRGPVTWTRQARFLSPSVHVCEWNDVFQQVAYGLNCENPLQGTRVTRVDLHDCGLAGSLPPELGSLASLRNLDLSGNNIEGTVPFLSLTQLPGLQELLLYQNMLTGTIPPAIGRLNPQGLRFLDLDENMLEGTVPTELGMLVKLERLYLNRNSDLSGTIPSEIGHLTSLRILDVGYNRLEGSLPTELLRCRSLSQVGFFSNKLSMTMTHALEALPISVTALLLAFNNVTGSIPSTVSRHSQLTQLNFRSTGVSGAIPSELGQLTRMQTIDWFNNELTGTIPTEIGLLGELRLWNVGLNKLRGPLPSEMGLLTKLTHLDVSENSLTGSPSVILGELGSLNTVHLQSNDWTEVESVCTGASFITHIGANSCEEANRYPCSCCTFCCESPPFNNRNCLNI